MPRPTRDSVFSDKSLRELIAPALFGEIAVHGNEWDIDRLEAMIVESDAVCRVKRNRHSTLASEQFELKGLLRQMLDCRISTDGVLDELSQVFPGARLVEIKHHRLWKMLMIGDPGRKAATEVMRGLPCECGERVCQAISQQRCGAFSGERYTLRDCIAGLGHVNVLVMLTAAFRDAQEHNISDVEPAGQFLRRIFPEVVSRVPQLFVRWRLLAQRYQEIGKISPFMSGFTSERTDLEEDVNAAARRARADGVPLPPDAMVATPEKWRVIKWSKHDSIAVYRFALGAGLLAPETRYEDVEDRSIRIPLIRSTRWGFFEAAVRE